jgi:hypothetical protein
MIFLCRGGHPVLCTMGTRGPVEGCCECGDEPSGSCATELIKPVQLDQGVVVEVTQSEMSKTKQYS